MGYFLFYVVFCIGTIRYNDGINKKGDEAVSIEQRIRLSLLIEKMSGQNAFSKRLGLEDKSLFHGECIRKEEKNVIHNFCDINGNGIW